MALASHAHFNLGWDTFLIAVVLADAARGEVGHLCASRIVAIALDSTLVAASSLSGHPRFPFQRTQTSLLRPEVFPDVLPDLMTRRASSKGVFVPPCCASSAILRRPGVSLP